VSGHRRDTMMDNLGWYLLLTAAQTAVLAAVVAWRLRRRARLVDPVVLAVGAGVAVDAFAGTGWPWWGT
jgi:Na+-transporting NADH:ubiquinone oxidoreductase subunit NqrE